MMHESVDNIRNSDERKSNKQRALGMLIYDAVLIYGKVGSFANASH